MVKRNGLSPTNGAAATTEQPLPLSQFSASTKVIWQRRRLATRSNSCWTSAASHPRTTTNRSTPAASSCAIDLSAIDRPRNWTSGLGTAERSLRKRLPLPAARITASGATVSRRGTLSSEGIDDLFHKLFGRCGDEGRAILQRFKWTERPPVETTDVAIGLGDD